MGFQVKGRVTQAGPATNKQGEVITTSNNQTIYTLTINGWQEGFRCSVPADMVSLLPPLGAEVILYARRNTWKKEDGKYGENYLFSSCDILTHTAPAAIQSNGSH